MEVNNKRTEELRKKTHLLYSIEIVTLKYTWEGNKEMLKFLEGTQKLYKQTRK